MKSKKRIFLGIVLSFIVLFTLTGCFKKTPITAEEFISKAEAYGLKAEDKTEQYAAEEKRIVKYVMASNEKGWNVEFFELATVDDCRSLYDSGQQEMEEAKAAVSSSSTVNGSNNQKYSQTSNGYFYVISRIDKTLVYIETKAANKDDVKAFLKTINY